MMKKVVLLFAVAYMVAACEESAVAPVVFETYEQDAEAQTPDSIPAHIGLRLDVPQGEDDVAVNMTSAIRRLIAGSQIAKELGEPANGTLQMVGDKYVETFMSRMVKDELEGVPAEYQLGITCECQNMACVRFLVVDGIYGNGGPYEYDAVVRKSDGHVMQQSEMVNIPMEDLKALVSKHATDEQKESLFFEDDGYQFSPDPQGCRFHWAVGSHFFQVVYIPLDEMIPYLTEAARPLFTAE